MSQTIINAIIIEKVKVKKACSVVIAFSLARAMMDTAADKTNEKSTRMESPSRIRNIFQKSFIKSYPINIPPFTSILAPVM